MSNEKYAKKHREIFKRDVKICSRFIQPVFFSGDFINIIYRIAFEYEFINKIFKSDDG